MWGKERDNCRGFRLRDYRASVYGLTLKMKKGGGQLKERSLLSKNRAARTWRGGLVLTQVSLSKSTGCDYGDKTMGQVFVSEHQRPQETVRIRQKIRRVEGTTKGYQSREGVRSEVRARPKRRRKKRRIDSNCKRLTW